MHQAYYLYKNDMNVNEGVKILQEEETTTKNLERNVFQASVHKMSIQIYILID